MAAHNIPIENNIIYTQRKGSTELKDSRETILLGAERVDVGVDSGEKEIARDEYSGLNYERNKIDSKTIYQLNKQKRKCFFVLDLETGRGGKSWYPGCIQVATINGENVVLKSEPSEDSQSLINIPNDTQIKVKDLVYDADKNIWYNILYNEIEGFVRNTYITNIRYVDPY